MSVRKIIWADTYDDDGYPYSQGLMDLHLGVIDPGMRCKTCAQKASDCPGHFGHIELAKPVIHVGYTRLIRKLLRVSCRSCGRLLLSPDEITKIVGTEEDESGDLVTEKDIKKERVCPYCGEQQFKVNFEKPTTFSEVIVEENGKKGEHKLTPADIRARLERIPDEDLRLLGINPDVARPEWTILTVLPVPPVTMRPSIILENGQRSEDDLTHKLVDIIRINQWFKENQDAGAPRLIIEDIWELLQYHVTTYLDNEAEGCPPAIHWSDRALMTLSQRLKGEEGRFRGTLSGKRVNFSARTVISPDPNLSIGEVGVPSAIADILTVRLRVTEKNIQTIRSMICNGTDRSQVADRCRVTRVISPQGEHYRITPNNLDAISDEIEPGWTVERQLKDGDIILLNRSPSLHRCRILAHRVVVMEGKTIRVHPSVCSSYGAKFDGDEMNLHLPQTEEARAEAHVLMSVEENLVFPRDGSPVVGVHKDILPAIQQFSRGAQWFTKEETLYLLAGLSLDHLPPAGKVENGVEYWSNRQIFSLLLPEDFSATFKTDACTNHVQCKRELCPRDAFFQVSRGRHRAGLIDSRALGAHRGLLTSRIYHRYGSNVAINFIKSASDLGIRFAMLHGVSFGLDDIEPPLWLNGAIRQKFASIPDHSKISAVQSQLDHLFLESMVSDLYTGHWGMFAPNISSPVYEAITGCIGQQYISEHGVRNGYKDRMLPHFKHDDTSPESRGFIKNGFRAGLNPVEFFFHAANERNRTVARMFQTVEAGYLQRRLSYALQDLMVSQDGSVRLKNGKIVQFSYGEDGTDPGKSSFGQAVDVGGIVEMVLEGVSYPDRHDSVLNFDHPDPVNALPPLSEYGETAKDSIGSYKEILADLPDIRRFIQVYHKYHPECRGSPSSWANRSPEQMVDGLIYALADEHSDIQCAAIDALTALGDVRAVEPLIAMLEDIALDVRAKAAEGLGKFGDTSAIPKLKVLLEDPFCYVRSKAAQSLNQLKKIAEIKNKTGPVGPCLENPVDSSDTEKTHLPTLFEAQGAVTSIDKCIMATPQNEKGPRCEVPGGGVPDLSDSEGPSLSFESLLNLLTAEDPEVRLFAVQILGKLGDPRAIEPIMDLLSDTEYAVFTAALEALEKLKGS